jgi:N-methylhydantoinase B
MPLRVGDARTQADPVTTEVVRHSLGSGAEQMKRALIRTAFSPVIYEAIDFAVALYDRQMRMLAQALGLPIFMGTLSFCVEAAVEAVGGEAALEPGDIVLYNWPYGSGSHPQDVALVMPAFRGDELIGYAVLKAHWLDIGGKEIYSTDTIDVFQEGTFFPGVKLYRRGIRDDDIYRIALANSRLPTMVAGDLNAEVVSVKTGVAALERIVARYGAGEFEQAIELMFDHGEAVVRSYFEQLPDGTYSGHSQMDNDGLSDEPVPVVVDLEVRGSNVTIDYSRAPEARPGPINCPRASTVSVSRVAVAMLAGAGGAPNEGHFRPITVISKPGTLFDPEPPSPCFLYAWSGFQAIEAILGAVAEANPNAVPAASGGDTCSLIWWGTREGTGEPWADGAPHPVGQGAQPASDGGSSQMHHGEAACRFPPVEVWETRNPWLLERLELAPDSGGSGQYRGGLGLDMFFRVLEDCWVTSALERTKLAPWGLSGGGEGRANAVAIRDPAGRLSERMGKFTGRFLPAGTTVELYTGGGGGFGPASDRGVEAVRNDLKAGYISESAARRDYPHAFQDGHG